MIDDIKYMDFKVSHIQGRYVTNDHITEYLQSLNAYFHSKSLGTSVQGQTIYGVTIGNGPIRILMWSQMHGNESTTTKAVLDLINYFKIGIRGIRKYLKKFYA